MYKKFMSIFDPRGTSEISCIAFVGAAVVNQLQIFPYYMLASLGFGALVVGWMYMLQTRLIEKKARKLFRWIGCNLLVFFILQMTCEYFFAGRLNLQALVWHCYFIPMTWIPLISLFLATYMNIGEENNALYFKLHWLCLPSAALNAALIISGLHQQATHSIQLVGNVPPNTIFDFSSNWLNMLSTMWVLVLIWLYVILICRKCFLTHLSPFMILPISMVMYGTVVALTYGTATSEPLLVMLHRMYGFAEIFAMLTICVWELCIQLGFFPRNNNLMGIFNISDINAQFIDRFGRVHSSATTKPLDKDILRKADNHPYMLNQNIRMTSREVRGGRIYWMDDMTVINSMIDEIEENNEQLKAENELIRRENELRAEQARWRAWNRLYQRLYKIIRPQVKKIDNLLKNVEQDSEEQFRIKLAEASVYCAYAKRRANLALIEALHNHASAEELYLAIREFLEYLQLCHVRCHVFEHTSEQMFLSKQLSALYDFFENAVEHYYPILHAAMVDVMEDQKDLVLNMELDVSHYVSAVWWNTNKAKRYGIQISEEYEDDCVYVHIRALEGGGGH